MALPKLQTPTHELKLPSSDQMVKYRPFLVKEEKILMMAQEGGDNDSIMNGVKQIIQNCVISPKLDVSKLAMFDLEYIFLKLRSKSAGEKVTVGIKCDKCDVPTDVEINLESIEVNKPEKHNSKIMLTDEIGITMRYPQIDTIKGMGTIETIDEGFEVIKRCVETIFTSGGDVHELRDVTNEEANEFFESLTSEQFQHIRDFFDTMPKLTHEVKFKCVGCGEDNTKILEGMNSFFK